MIVGGLDLHRKASLDIIRLTVILYKTGGNIYEKVSIFYNCSNCRFAAVLVAVTQKFQAMATALI